MRHKVNGYHDKIYGPAVTCDVIIPSLNINVPAFPFLIDSGAAISMLTYYYAKQLNINFGDTSKLRKTDPVSGIGGSIDSYLVEAATLVFHAEDGYKINFEFPDWSFNITKIENIDPDKLEELTKSLAINIIGRDVLLHPHFHFSYSPNGVILEVDE